MYKLHSLQHPDWLRTGTSYCYFYIFEIIHHHSVIFSKTYPSFLTVKEGDFRIPPSLLQGELHFSHQASLSSGTRGCSWLRYSLRQSSGIVSGACAHKGLPISVYATELRLFVGWRIIKILSICRSHANVS